MKFKYAFIFVISFAFVLLSLNSLFAQEKKEEKKESKEEKTIERL